MLDILRTGPVVPVATLDDAALAAPLARALLEGGVRVLEITLRTPAALDAIRAVARDVPDAIVGAGTILDPDQLQRARAAGARFGASPGLSTAVLAAARADGWPFLPGVMTPSDVMAALAAGAPVLKFFPAAQAGGVRTLQDFGSAFPQARFCPSGGIGPGEAPDYLALANVVCVAGSWLAPAALVRAGDWRSITRLAQQASALRT